MLFTQDHFTVRYIWSSIHPLSWFSRRISLCALELRSCSPPFAIYLGSPYTCPILVLASSTLSIVFRCVHSSLLFRQDRFTIRYIWSSICPLSWFSVQSSICNLSRFSLHQHHLPYLFVCTWVMLWSILVLTSSTSGNCNYHNHLSPFLFWVIKPRPITTTVNADER